MTSPLLPSGPDDDLWASPFEGLDPPLYFGEPQMLPGDIQKWWKWLAGRTEQTASSCAPKIGMCLYAFVRACPYGDSHPHWQWRLAVGISRSQFAGSDDTRYGETYEDRVRQIAQRVLQTMRAEAESEALEQLEITEYGLFRSALFAWMGISPDGITNAVRVSGMQPHWDVQTQKWVRRPFSVVAGKAMFEVKCSRMHEYEHPQVGHLVQVMMQMYVTQRRFTVMHYWSRDRMRMFLVEFSPDMWRWMERRMILFHEHVVRRVPLFDEDERVWPVEGSAPYFDWLLNTEKGPLAWGNRLGNYCKDMWFWRSKQIYHGRQLRAPLTLADWEHSLARLGMTHEQYVAVPGYARNAPVITVDPATGVRQMEPSVDAHMVPPRPAIYEIYRFQRPVPAEEQDLMQPEEWIKPVDASNREFFEREYPHISEYYQYQMQQFDERELPDAPLRPPWHEDAPADADLIMDRLYVERLERVPELDEPEPVDCSDKYPLDPERAAECKARYDAYAAKMAPPPPVAAPPPFMRHRRPPIKPTPLPLATAGTKRALGADDREDDEPPVAPPLRSRWLAHLQKLALPEDGKSLQVMTKRAPVPLLVIEVEMAGGALPAACAPAPDDYARICGLHEGRRVTMHYNMAMLDLPALVAELPWCAGMEWLLADAMDGASGLLLD